MFTKSDIIETLNLLTSSDLGSNMIVHNIGNSRNGRFPFIVSLEGNIGAGKSTIVEKMRQKYEGLESDKYFGKLAKSQIVFMQEPVDVWTSVCDSTTGESILEKFYKDPKTYSFAFQVMVYNTHLEAFRKVVRENPECVLLICERSIDAGRHIFAEMLRDDGMIDDVCFQVYEKLFESTAGEFPLDAILYLDVAPEVCLERIGTRAREGENGIPLEYLAKCDRYYKKWLSKI
jgi:deoxyadenosine/deoxycytidine kinase